jgi:hypothetical protein
MEISRKVATTDRREPRMEAYVLAKVEALGLDADVYVDYGRGILEDEDMALEERVESVIAIFSGAADGLASDATVARELNARAMVEAVERLLSDAKARLQQDEEVKRAEAQLRDLQIREQEKKAAEAAVEKEKEKLLARQQMSRDELAAREKLISAYGFSAISEFDEDGNIIKTKDKVWCWGSSGDVGKRLTRRLDPFR